ncbi:MAG: hypothetical protein ABT19_09455 [Rhodanobacter sp. SCN 68-63]|nr:MAG: hypothetical protein ABT19_09455 [Rhodanobacter sp. SCN 68-63]
MKAVWQLSLQLWRRMPVLVVLAGGLWIYGMGMLVWSMRGDQTLATIGMSLVLFGGWFWHVGQGQLLRGLCRPESFLLPGFRRRLGELAIVDVALWVLLPALLAAVCGMPYVWLATTGLLLAAALGLASGTGRRAGVLIWLVVIAAGWMPQLAAKIAQAALHSRLTPVALLLAAVLILKLVLRPLLRIDDSEPDVSPLESTGLNRLQSPSMEGTPPRGAIGKRVNAWFDGMAQRAMEHALVSYRRRPGARQRLALIRSLLLPHDNPPAIALRLVLVAAMVTLYFVVIQHRPHYNAAVIGAYAVLLSLSRFPQLGRGMLRMRPNLADLYLTLAPASRSEYQKTLVDALLLLVPVTALSALAYTALGIVLVHATEPGRMLLTAGPEGSLGRGLVNIVVVLGAMATYWGGYVLLGALGLSIGGAVLALLTISFGFGVWFAAQREYQRRPPCFDAPLA